MPRFLEVMRQNILLQARGKVYLLLLALSALFACIFLFMPPNADRVRGSELFQLVTYGAGFTGFLPFVTMFLAVQAVSGDIEDRTSVYLFTRPISRVSLMVGKWLAVIVLGSLFAVTAISTLYVVIAFGPKQWQDGSDPVVGNYVAMTLAGCIAVVGYSAIGCLSAAIFRRPLLVAILYIMVEQFVSRLPPQVGIHSATVAFPIRAFMYTHVDMCNELEQTLRAVGNASRSQQQQMMLAEDPYLAIGKVVLVAMAIAIWVYSRREYDSRPRE